VKVFVIASFVARYGMQAVMFTLLMRPQGVRVHAPVAGTEVPRETTVAGDAWFRGGTDRVEVRVRDEATGRTWSVPAERDASRYRERVASQLAAWHAEVSFPSDGRYALPAAAVGPDGTTVEAR
jgi:hypothetical protein